MIKLVVKPYNAEEMSLGGITRFIYFEDVMPNVEVGSSFEVFTPYNIVDPVFSEIVTKIETIEVHVTQMYLNGNLLPNQIYSRDQIEETDNEFAETCGFEGFSEMRDAISTSIFGPGRPLPLTAKVMNWS